MSGSLVTEVVQGQGPEGGMGPTNGRGSRARRLAQKKLKVAD